MSILSQQMAKYISWEFID